MNMALDELNFGQLLHMLNDEHQKQCFSKWAVPPSCGRWNESGGAVAASSKIGER